MSHRTIRSVRFLVVGAIVACGLPAQAALTLNSAPTAADMRLVLDGPGLALENLKITKGIKGQYGIFTGGEDPVGTDPTLSIADGLFMNTGNTGSILGPNSKKDYTYNTTTQYADIDLTRLSVNAIYDPAIIEFDMIPEGDRVNFLLVFGSDEYPEYVCSKFNDVFGLFVSGPGLTGTKNAAFLPDTQYAIAVNNVNAGQAGSKKDGAACQLGNSLYFKDNGDGSGKQGTQLDGFTTPITASLGGLQPKQRYHIKLALADAGDQAYGSAAFFKWLTSTSSTEVDLSLKGAASTTKPDKNGYVDITYTITNHSANATRLVTANIELPAGVSLMGEDSGGLFDPISGEWTVGNVAAKGTRTLQLRTKVGTDLSYRIPAELTYAFNEDPDSTPYNRLAKPNEDDTSVLLLTTISNVPPSITTNNSAPTHSISIPENTSSAVLDYSATDTEGEAEGKGLVWNLGGGQDDALFNLDGTGLLRFKSPADFEKPLDQGADNQYQTLIKVCDSYQSCDQQTLTVSVTDLEEDRDHDGLNDDDELRIGSNPDNPDTDGDGLDDKTEAGDLTLSPPDLDGDNKPNILDTDDDGDGIPTIDENHNGGTAADDDTDQDGSPDYLDTDDDNDGILTKSENYNGGTALDDDTDKDGIPNYRDTDDDGDSIPTRDEGSTDTDADGTANFLDTDDDNDAVPTAQENHNGGTSADDDTDKDGKADYLDTDDDGDGILTQQENFNGGTPADDDTDQDGKPNYADTDDDNDGVLSLYENYNGSTPADDDTDKDGTADYLDVDDDGDGKASAAEGNDPNGDHKPDDALDADTDKIPNYLDLYDQHDPAKDNDGDGLTNGEEAILGSNPDDPDSDRDGLPDKLEIGSVGTPTDSDHDGKPDLIDPDDDNDGVPTVDENQGSSTPKTDSDADETPDYLDTDDDNDGVPTVKENYNGGTPKDDDTDKDGKPDYLDTDDDNDSIATWYENYNGNTSTDDDTDKDGKPDYLDTDDDNDGLLTLIERPDPNGNGNPDDGQDSDKDKLHDYRDMDDDNDGRLTKDEKPDPNKDGNPADAADDDLDTIVDYLDPVVTPFIRLSMRALLQGAYNNTSGLMEDDLRKKGYLPTAQPYGSLGDSFGYTNSPYAASPFSHAGSEKLTDKVATVTGNDAIVDWMLIEIRDKADPSKRVATRAGILQRDGDVVDAATGSPEILIHEVAPGDYYVVASHRNHMGVMTATPVALSPVSTLYDFTKPSTPVYGKNARISSTTLALMRAGDVNNSSTLIVSGPGNDVNVILGALLIAPGNAGVNSSYQLLGYFATDVNLDGATIYAGPNNDANLMLGNVLMHPDNTTFNSNYIVNGTVPKYK